MVTGFHPRTAGSPGSGGTVEKRERRVPATVRIPMTSAQMDARVKFPPEPTQSSADAGATCRERQADYEDDHARRECDAE